MKPLLLKWNSCLKRRLHLYDSTVGSCVLWCAQSWTLRTEEIRFLKTAQRAMLRRIVPAGRGPDEDYINYIRRTTRRAVIVAKETGVRDWIEASSRYKWGWAGHVAQRPSGTWVSRISSWRDSEWQAIAMEMGSSRPMRPSRRRWMKWEDALRRFCSSEGSCSWTELAANRYAWANKPDAFVKWSFDGEAPDI